MSEIELNGSLTTTKLKKPHPSTLVRGARTGPTPMWIKIWERYLRIEESQTHTRSPSPGCQCQEDNSPQLLAAKTSGDWVTGALSISSWGTHTQTHLLKFNPSELQHQGSSLKVSSGIQARTEMSGIKVSRSHCPFSKPSPPQSPQAGAISETLST